MLDLTAIEAERLKHWSNGETAVKGNHFQGAWICLFAYCCYGHMDGFARATCTVDQSDGINITYSTVARDFWRRKQTLSSGCALGLGSFTAINP